jgi:hypothetical protein
MNGNLGFKKWLQDEPNYAKDHIGNVTTKVSGIFLWVVSVIDSLLEGLTNGERFRDLQKRRDALHADLEKAFWHIVNSSAFTG